MYDVTLYSYSGMPVPLAENVEKEEAKNVIQRTLRRARRLGKPIDKLDKGRWEIQTPDDAFLVSDSEGILTVKRHRSPRQRNRRVRVYRAN